jgi:hypothetical protein
VLSNGWALSKDFGQISHGYVSTAYSAQGRTVDHVILAVSATSYPAISREGFYVCTSRGKQSVSVFTDSKRDLKKAIERSNARLTATELVSLPKPQLWSRIRDTIGRIHQAGVVAAKRAAYQLEQSLQPREAKYAYER